jgi:hypothetical protein
MFRQKELDDLNVDVDEESDENNLPNKSSLVVNAILACLEDDNQMVKRGMLDFMFTHLRLNRVQYLEPEDKLILVEGALLLLIKKDNMTRKVN